MQKSIDLYSEDDLRTMRVASKISASQKNRLSQIIEYLKELNYKTIGIVNCIAFQKQSVELRKFLEAEGFKIVEVNCREGSLNKDDYTDDKNGSSCNPIYQAKIMKDANVDFVIVLGLCVGHDVVFQKYCNKPYTNLVVKDFTNKHKTIELFE